ncbi:MAG: hypothetical protein KAS96_00440, partial [Planctomycetes bacterium]|nr:hypothetical protein [Planctomycetota bacterium]
PEIKNCVFYGNEAKDGDGGAIFNYDESSPLIISCTFAENTVGANYDGLGVYNCDDSTSIVNSCIFWNESTSDHQIINDGSSASVIGFSDVQDCGGSGVANWEPVFGFDAGGNIDSAPDFYNYTDVNGADNKLGTSDDGLLPMFYGVIDSADGYNVTLRDITNNERVDAVSLVDMSGGPITYADMGAYETFYYFYGFDYEPNVVVMCFINESDGDAYSDNFLGEDLYNADMKEYVDILMDNSSYKIASGCFVPGNPVYAVIPNACELPDNIYTSTFPRDNPSPLQSDFKNAFRTICGYGQPDDIIIVIDNSGSMTPDTLNVDGAYDNFLVWLGDEYTTTNIYQYTIKNPYIGGNFDGTSGTDCIERWLDAINEALKKLSYIN